MTTEDTAASFLRWRGVEDPCGECSGSGVRVYGSTSTWRGGMGGAAMTRDVCDHCWGSGDRHHPWTDLRKLCHEQDKHIAERSVGLLLERAGLLARPSRSAQMSAGRDAVMALISELDRFADQPRKPRPRWFREICKSLARTLQSGVAEGSDA